MSCPVVNLKNGKVKGFEAQLKCKDVEKPVCVYRSIPYAKPPVGSLRFKPPQPADPWTGVLDGTKLANRPMQSATMLESMSKVFAMKIPKGQTAKMDEDCLYLTVYTPEAVKGKKLAVMVWFYGGGFQIGDDIGYDGSALAGMQNVVVVVPNYRVNMFGFLTLGRNSDCPGNFGLLDQTMSLEWVRDNINEFGGDPGNITIFGESAGAVAVGFHLLSPLSRGLFHKAISQSGTCAMTGAIMSDQQVCRSTEKILAHLKIEEKDDQKKLEALQKIPAADLMKAQEALMLEKVYYYTVVDGNFLCAKPEDVLDGKDFTKVPYLLGCNSTEGNGLMAMALGPDFATGIKEEQVEAGISMEKNKHIMESWKKYYLSDDVNDKLRFSKFFGNVVADGMFVYPTLRAAKCHSASVSETFMYQGAFQLRMFHDDKYRGELLTKVDWCECDHGDEIQMVFGVPFTPGDLEHGATHSPEEEQLSRKVMTYFANFAKHGDPNKGDKVEVTWPKFGSSGKYLVIDHKLRAEENLSPKVFEYWSKTVADLRLKYPDMD